MTALSRASISSMETLIQAGADVNVRNYEGDSPLNVVVNEISRYCTRTSYDRPDRVQSVKALLRFGAKVNWLTKIT